MCGFACVPLPVLYRGKLCPNSLVYDVSIECDGMALVSTNCELRIANFFLARHDRTNCLFAVLVITLVEVESVSQLFPTTVLELYCTLHRFKGPK